MVASIREIKGLSGLGLGQAGGHPEHVEQDWLLDEDERLRLVQPYHPVSPAWRSLGWAGFWAAVTVATLLVALFFSFSSRVEDWLLLSVGATAALALVSLGTAAALAILHRQQMEGPYEALSEAAIGSSTQMGTSRPARAM